jgi:hypothetical protein
MQSIEAARAGTLDVVLEADRAAREAARKRIELAHT